MKNFLIGVGIVLIFAWGVQHTQDCHAKHGPKHNPYDAMTLDEALAVTEYPAVILQACVEDRLVDAVTDTEVENAVTSCYDTLNLASQAALRIIISSAYQTGDANCVNREGI